MTVVSDSYMGFFLPSNIYEKISKFLEGSLGFPFIDRDEILGIFFLFGKNFGIKTHLDMLSAKDITRKTIDQLKREIYLSRTITQSSIESIKENYQRRILQIYIELQNSPTFEEKEINKRISRDPTILLYCYTHHISYYRQKCFFEIYDPFKKDQIDKKLHNLLLNRMLMLSYNVEKSDNLPFNTLHPFINWILRE